MAAVTVRNIPEETHQAFKLRAAHDGRSTEAEIRVILEEAVAPPTAVGLASQLAAFGRRYDGIELGVTGDPRPAEPADFS